MGERAIVTYENRVYRYEIRALQEVVERIMPALEASRQLTLIPQHRGLPMVALSIPVDAYRSFAQGETSVDQFVAALDVSLSVEPFWQAVQASRPANRSFFKFDLVVHPQFAAQFGNFQDPVESQVNVAPEITTSLWKGMRLSAQMIIPIQNELEEEGDYLRPGLLTLNQTLRLPSSTFISGSAGYFTRNRYGVDVDLKKYVAEGRWALGAEAGYTGPASFQRGRWSYANPSLLTYAVSAAYHVKRYNLQVRSSFGKFLQEDVGARVEVRRAFGEVHIGFFGIKTGREENAGFSVVLPLFPHKYSKPGRLRARPAGAFSWAYRYRGFPLAGRRYETGNDLETFWRGLTPAFIKNLLRDRWEKRLPAD